jgi:hypothetical protein
MEEERQINKSRTFKIAMKKRTTVIGSLSAAALFLVSLSASAENVIEFTAPFDTIATSGHPQLGGSCPEIDWPLHLVGTLHVVVHDTFANGVHHFVVQEGIHGDATDGAGNNYVFAYQNSLRAEFAISLGDPTTTDFDTDTFTLSGPAGNLHVSFSGALIFDANGNWVGANLTHAVANVACDPL